MAGFCPAAPADTPLVRGLLYTVDCSVQGLAREGYARLADPAGPILPVLTALLTLYVAFIGYRLLLGRGALNVGDLTLSLVKVGGVLLFATNWGAYQSVVYEALFHGPEQLAARLLDAVQPQGSGFRGEPFEGLQAAHDALTSAAQDFAQRAGPANPMLGGPAFAAAALNGSAFLLLISTVGTLLAAKVVLAILLALAPLFVGLFLFDATRGVLEGWLKAAVAFALAPLLVTLTLAVELTVLEPGLVELAKAQAESRLQPADAVSILVLCLVFAGVLAAAALAVAAIAAGLRLPRTTPRREPGPVPAMSAPAAAPSALTFEAPAPARAARAAAALAAMDRRDLRLADALAFSGDGRPALAGPAPWADPTAAPLGSSFRRRAAPARSRTADRRDRGAA